MRSIFADTETLETASITDLELSWPPTATPLQLESSSDIGAQLWSPVEASATVKEKGMSVSIPVENGTRFFRLKGQ